MYKSPRITNIKEDIFVMTTADVYTYYCSREVRVNKKPLKYYVHLSFGHSLSRYVS